MEKKSFSNNRFNIMEKKSTNLKNNKFNKFNFIVIILILLAILYLYWYYFRDIFDSSIRFPHPYNADEDIYLNKEKDSPVIGMEPKTHQTIHELSDEEKENTHDINFYTVSDLIDTDIYFANHKEIKIKDFNENCKEIFGDREPAKFYDCLKKHELIETDNNIINNEYHDINIYTNEKIMNGGEFMDGITGFG